MDPNFMQPTMLLDGCFAVNIDGGGYRGAGGLGSGVKLDSGGNQQVGINRAVEWDHGWLWFALTAF